MPIATDLQVQAFVDQRIRPHSEAIRNIYLALVDDKASIDDVYSAVTEESPTWSDNRTDGPPHLLTPADVLSYNAFMTAFIAFITTTDPSDYTTIEKACVRPVA